MVHHGVVSLSLVLLAAALVDAAIGFVVMIAVAWVLHGRIRITFLGVGAGSGAALAVG
jgi:hypothetical protein